MVKIFLIVMIINDMLFEQVNRSVPTISGHLHDEGHRPLRGFHNEGRRSLQGLHDECYGSLKALHDEGNRSLPGPHDECNCSLRALHDEGNRSPRALHEARILSQTGAERHLGYYETHYNSSNT